MNDKELRAAIRRINSVLKGIVFIIILVLVIVVYAGYSISPSIQTSNKPQKVALSNTRVAPKPKKEIIDGVHQATGLKEGAGLQAVIQNCTSCHSAKLITQNRMNKSGWLSTIRWMQETQNLWDLGENEESIVNYLATYYAPQKKGRRARLTTIEWYELD